MAGVLDDKANAGFPHKINGCLYLSHVGGVDNIDGVTTLFIENED